MLRREAIILQWFASGNQLGNNDFQHASSPQLHRHAASVVQNPRPAPQKAVTNVDAIALSKTLLSNSPISLPRLSTSQRITDNASVWLKKSQSIGV
jgi:hypothetical protein